MKMDVFFIEETHEVVLDFYIFVNDNRILKNCHQYN